MMDFLEVKRTPGFRFNLIDAVFLLFLGTLSYLLFQSDAEHAFAVLPIYLGISFFCFCNIFRIGNKMEPFWYIPFTVVTGYCIYTFNFELYCLWVIYFLEPLKWGLILFHMLRRPYYGIAYERVNRLKARYLPNSTVQNECENEER